MGEQRYSAINVYPDVYERVAQIKSDNRFGSMNDVVEVLLDAYESQEAAERGDGDADDADRQPVEIDQSDLAREVSARIDYTELARKTADNIREDLR